MPRPTLSTPAGRVSAMMRTVGATPPAAGLGTLASRCADCSHPASCEAWLADQGGKAERAPGYCLNAERLLDMIGRPAT